MAANGTAVPAATVRKHNCVGIIVVRANPRTTQPEAYVQQRSAGREIAPGCWEPLGRHIETGETIHTAAERELAEELGGDTLLPLKYYDVTNVGVREDTVYDLREAYITFADGLLGEVFSKEPQKIQGYKWVSMDQLAGMPAEFRTTHGSFYRKALELAAKVL